MFILSLMMDQQDRNILTQYQSFFLFYQLMHKWITLKTILKFTLEQLLHVSVQSPSSWSALFVLA